MVVLGPENVRQQALRRKNLMTFRPAVEYMRGDGAGPPLIGQGMWPKLEKPDDYRLCIGAGSSVHAGMAVAPGCRTNPWNLLGETAVHSGFGPGAGFANLPTCTQQPLALTARTSAAELQKLHRGERGHLKTLECDNGGGVAQFGLGAIVAESNLESDPVPGLAGAGRCGCEEAVEMSLCQYFGRYGTQVRHVDDDCVDDVTHCTTCGDCSNSACVHSRLPSLSCTRTALPFSFRDSLLAPRSTHHQTYPPSHGHLHPHPHALLSGSYSIATTRIVDDAAQSGGRSISPTTSHAPTVGSPIPKCNGSWTTDG